MVANREQEGLPWQTGVWNRIADLYQREIDPRFAPVVEHVIARAALAPGQYVLDLGTGTGAVAERAAAIVGPHGHVVGVDLSPVMLVRARERCARLGVTNIILREGRAEAIPAPDSAFDVVLASLSCMYILDRAAAARDIARVLRPGGRLVAAVWAGADQCDIVRFQQTAGQFAGPPPVPGVGPGALADPRPFLQLLAAHGITARVETETLGFDFADFASGLGGLGGGDDGPSARRTSAGSQGRGAGSDVSPWRRPTALPQRHAIHRRSASELGARTLPHPQLSGRCQGAERLNHCVVEDLHWLDAETQAVLTHMVESVPTARGKGK